MLDRDDETSLFFMNNPLLRRKGIIHQYSQFEEDEYEKCMDDPMYFMNNYIKVLTLDTGVTNFIPRPYQERIVKAVHENRYTICLIPRQAGKSTTVGAYLLYLATFNDNYKILVGAHVLSAAIDFIARIKTAYEELPFWLKLGIVKYNDLKIVFENGSEIRAVATTKSSGRGGTFNCVVLDEFAHVQRNIADAFYAAVRPTIASGTDSKMIIISTPLGLNHFHTLWEKAVKKKNEFSTVDCQWYEIPGRDENFKKRIIEEFGEPRWKQEFECVEKYTLINIRNKQTGEIKTVPIGELYNNVEYM